MITFALLSLAVGSSAVPSGIGSGVRFQHAACEAFDSDFRLQTSSSEPQTAASSTDDWFTIGEITVFGRAELDGRKLPEQKVQIKFPRGAVPAPDESAPFVRWGDWKVQLNEWGNPMRAYRGAGGWDEFQQLYKAAQDRIKAGGANVWRCKAVVFRETNVLYKRADGGLQPQRAYINDRDLQFCLETFARVEALVEAFTRGAIDMQVAVGVEDEAVTGYYEGDQVWSLHPFDAGDNYLRARFNRGDYDCILYMFHPGPTRAFSFGGTIGRTNGATQAYVILSNGREQGVRIGHTEAMLHEWFHQVEDTYSRHGYGGYDYSWLPNLHSAAQNGYTTDSAGHSGWFSWLRDLMIHSVRPGMWAKLKNREDPDWVAVRRQTHRSEGGLYRWSQVSDDPWAKLPYLTPDDLTRRIGASALEVQHGESQVLFLPKGIGAPTVPQLDPDDFSLNNQLNFGREAMARISYRDRDLLFVRFDAADFVIANLADHPKGADAPANVLGYISVDAKLMVVLDTKLSNETRAELNLLSLGSDKVGISIPGKGEFLRNETPRLTFTANAADARFTVAEWDGTPLTLSGEELRLPKERAGTQFLKVTAVLANGERVERPFVVRLLDPVDANLEAVGTRRMSGRTHDLKLTLTNGSEGRTLKLAAAVPAGWKLEGLESDISLAPGQREELKATVSAPADAADGPYAVSVDLIVAGYAGPTRTERLTLIRDTKPTLIEHRFSEGVEKWDAPRADRGGWKVETQPSGVEGNCLAVMDQGGTHWGRVTAFGGYVGDGRRDPKFMGYDVSSYPYIDFHLKTEAEHTLGLVVTLSDGGRYAVLLAGPYVEQWGKSVQLPRAKFVPNGQWQRVVYDLKSALAEAAGPGPHYVVDIGFGDTRQFSSNQWFTKVVSTHYVDSFRITREADLTDNTTKEDPDAEIKAGAEPTSSKADDRVRACVSVDANSSPAQVAAIRALLNDPSPVVKLNAAAAFARVKDAESVPLLIEMARLERDPDVGIYTVRALAHQDTPEAWQAISQLTRSSRHEEQPMAEAAAAMARKANAAFVAPGRLLPLEGGGQGGGELAGFVRDIGVLLSARSWQTRREAAKALGSMPREAAQQTLMAFLHEVDPHVRLEVAKSANVDVEPVGRRMEWGSVNDLSAVVRAYCYARLTRSADPVVRSRGYIGLKEPDVEIRRIIALEMGNDPKEHHVQHLQGLLSDPNPDVRAVAVESLLKIRRQPSYSELSVLSGEDYEQVLLPLLRGAKERKLELPRAVLERLITHRNAEVRGMARELLG